MALSCPHPVNQPVIWSTEAWGTCTNLLIMKIFAMYLMMSLKLSDSKKDVHKRCFIHQKQGTWSYHHRFTNSFSQRLGEMNTLTRITQNTPPLRHGYSKLRTAVKPAIIIGHDDILTWWDLTFHAIYLYMYHRNQPNVSVNMPYMVPMGIELFHQFCQQYMEIC